MFKRLTWMTMGTGVGAGLALWGQRKVKAKVARYQPARVTAELAGSVRRLGEGVRVAAEEGRTAMRDREAELRGTRPGPVARSGGP
ncbi:MAG TPA: hypothetical protein VGV93_10110 [Acidimicrobiales bacterium]|nr:hypothetical protein [Acidimicrobiales bacterium]